MSGFFALLDDIATLAKLTLSTIDDTASIAVKTTAKVSAAAVDDVAATPQYVTSITADRELPIIRRIVLGSLRNKFLVILPVGLLLTAVAPALLPVTLIVGGSYLCFEGGEKLLAPLLGQHGHEGQAPPRDEESIVRRATATDFILSTEILLLAMASVEETPLRRVVVLSMVALLVTIAVYGLVALLIKADDLGVHLAQSGRSRFTKACGRGIVRLAPGTFKVIGCIGTVAMLWVGGEILAHNLEHFGLHYPYGLIAHASRVFSSPVLSWLAKTSVAFLVGAVLGSLLVLLWTALRQVLPTPHHGQSA